MDWFLYDNGPRHERVKVKFKDNQEMINTFIKSWMKKIGSSGFPALSLITFYEIRAEGFKNYIIMKWHWNVIMIKWIGYKTSVWKNISSDSSKHEKSRI